ncbi:MarR family winged helix-turn-helix transcriptional regulator [Paenibacillus thermotolerans]|uniref:MarR family winged helix-turn-helix transcriptional regulator n=1 Tax=Paenibacillus thermotolerans TaxID=3027807 RepID=UPI00236831E8|nr:MULTISPECIES: MarR family transcriptional regulator [unclassified Paenibacillus]
MRELNQAFYHVTHKVAEEHGTTRIQYLTLRKLKLHPMMRLSELAEQLRTNASTASAVVDRLVHSGLIVRETPSNDRRSVLLKLSAEGEEVLGRTDEALMKRLSPLLQLPEEEVEELIRIQGKIISILQQLREES